MDNYSQASQRLHKDANTLYDLQRYETAGHLYGLSAECSIKTFILQQPGQTNVPFKHLPELLDDAKRLMSGRVRSHLLNLISRPDYMAGWQVANRYWADQQFSQQQCKDYKQDATDTLRCVAAI